MSTYAKIRVIGYVGKDPVCPMQNNPNFVTLSLSVTEKRKDKDTKEEIKTTTWYECQTGNEGTAGLIKKYVKKGALIEVEGFPRCNAYLDKEGKPAVSFKINIKELNILVFPANKEESKPAQVTFQNDLLDDEIPF